MKFALFHRKLGLRPTKLGWCLLILFPLTVTLIWIFYGETFLAADHRVSGNILIVEGWIGRQALQHAAEEFRSGQYDYVVTTGGFTDDSWSDVRWCYAEMAAKELKVAGIPSEKIIVARAGDTANQRTFEQAMAGREYLAARGLKVSGINVFTSGMHARRTWAVFSKVFGTVCQVGVISWMPPQDRATNWWNSSVRAEDFVKETAGWLYETTWSSGR